MLVGFPGETEEEFETLCRFIEEMRFERVGVFQYSHEEGTSAHQLEDDVPAELKASRAARLMAIQEDISFEKNETKIGQTLKVLFDRKEGAYFVGRTEFDSPEVDNEVLVKARKSYVRIGDFAHVKITNVEAFDLYGTIANT
jgi:ribosomal protein S12 methylthiotransferase